MAAGYVNVTEGSGKKLETWTRTIGANSVEDQAVYPAEFPLACYTVAASGISCANAGDDIIQIMAGSSLHVRIRRIRIEQSQLITAAAITLFNIYRVTSAGTAGTAVTPSKMDNSDAASGATAAKAVPTATSGTAGALMLNRLMFPTQTASTAGSEEVPHTEWVQLPGMKPIVIPAGTTNGIVIRNNAARAGLQVAVEVEFTETSFL